MGLFSKVTSSLRRGDVYLIHLDDPLSKEGNQHYMGFSTNLSNRIALHEISRGSRFLSVANERGIKWRVVRVWRNVPASFERQLKRRKEGPVFCPICNPERALNNATEGNAYIMEEFE